MIAVYRILYGGQFLQDSVESFIDHVDQVYIFWTDRPWGEITSVHYMGAEVEFPKKWDTVLEVIDLLKKKYGEKIIAIYDYFPTPCGQISHLVNTYIKPLPDYALFIEPDHVFKEGVFLPFLEEFKASEVPTVTCRQVELWRYMHFRIPERHRMGPFLWCFNGLTEMPETQFFADAGPYSVMDHFVHNTGYAYDERIMYWKHLTGIGFANYIKDNQPREDWFERTWLGWHPNLNNENLEPAVGYQMLIKEATMIKIDTLPQSLIKHIPKWMLSKA